MPHERQNVGAAGERAAERYLRQHRYVILARNYRCAAGEVDLVALDRGVVVFVEVKTRRGDRFGGPLDAVDRRKQARIARVANFYIAQHRLDGRLARFDVVGVRREGDEIACELVRDAFQIAT